MGYEFNADEIFEMAEQIERNGAKFYRKLGKSISDNSIRLLLLDLAVMEDKHERVFSSMRKDLSDQEREETIFDPEGEAVLYLKALADLNVFDKEAEEDFVLAEGLTKKEKIKKVLREAINREKEAIVFFLGMREFIPENLGKNKINAIIREEMKHIRLLAKKMSLFKG